MTTSSPAFDLALLPAVREREELIRDVQAGLHSRPRSLKPWIFYDELGSELRTYYDIAGILSDAHRTFTP